MRPGDTYGPYVVMEKERVDELESQAKHVENIVTNGSAQLRSARKELEAARRVLAFYAERKNWRPGGFAAKVAAHDDAGRRAREALGIF